MSIERQPVASTTTTPKCLRQQHQEEEEVDERSRLEYLQLGLPGVLRLHLVARMAPTEPRRQSRQGGMGDHSVLIVHHRLILPRHFHRRLS